MSKTGISEAGHFYSVENYCGVTNVWKRGEDVREN